MVEMQIERRGIESPAVLDAMRSVPRHEFVAEAYRNSAYTDQPLPIGEGQTISQPYIVALMTDLLQCGPEDTVLEIGTGSGYQSAVLAELVAHVFTIEIVEILAGRADSTLKALGLGRIGKSRQVPDNPEIRGMIRKVTHLVVIDDTPDN